MTEFRCQVCDGNIPSEYDIYFVGGRLLLCKYCASEYLTLGLSEE